MCSSDLAVGFNITGGAVLISTIVQIMLVSLRQVLRALGTRIRIGPSVGSGESTLSLVRSYRHVQIVQSLLNLTSLSTFVFPGLVLIVSLATVLSLHEMVKRTTPLALGFTILQVGIASMFYYITGFALFWRITESSNTLLCRLEGKARTNHSRIQLRLVRSCRSVNFTMGMIGNFNKAVYLVIAKLVVEYSLAVLFM